MKTRHKISLVGLFAAAVALFASPVVHAQINTGIEYGSATGLGGGDIRTIVGRIIQVFLGILGVVALVLIIYAGWLWMTAGGDEEKVTQAKKIMTQAVIGLAIILCSFAITTWIVSQLTAATGFGGGNGGGGGGGGSLPPDQFAAQSITPPGSKAADFLWPKNSHVTVVLKNGDPDPSTVPDSIAVTSNGLPVSGTITASGNVLVFAATAVCTENPSYTCLPGNASIHVALAPTLKSTTGKTLGCGLCSATFLTSNLIDTQNPTVAIVSPPDGASVSVDAFVPVISNPNDDVAVASVELFANGATLGSIGVPPWQEDWDTTGIPAGTNVTLSATATDEVGNTGLAPPVTVTVRPAHCFDNTMDDGETGLNCGDGCGACAGGSCTQNSDCASGLCQNGVCVNRPRIDSVTPLSGGPGTLVSIKGASFGSAPGSVEFLGSTAAGDEKEAAPCAPSAWTDTQVVVGVPEGAVTGPLQITNTDNLSDRTDDDFGNTAIPDFTVNTTVHPGICILTPNAGPTGTSVVISGNGYGDAQAAGGVSVAARSAVVQSWAGTQIAMTTPNLLGGSWPVVVTASGLDSNSVDFSVPLAGSSAPHLDAIDPETGPVGQYVTLTGANFGDSPGKVTFTSGTYSALGGVDFPPACGNGYWTNSSVTVKVPAGLPLGGVTTKLTRADAVDSDNTLPFTIVSGNPSAGICRINPSTGPAGTVYEINGERLGNDKGKVVFRNNVDASALISSWDDGRVSGAVPGAAVTGSVYAVSAAASQSNPLNFNVADCRKAQVCSGAEECCQDDGTCRLPNPDGSSGCQPIHLSASYRYRYSTGDIPVTPQVVEEIDCAVRSQSPSPYKDVTDACANSVGSVRFTIPMNKATLTISNFKMVDCGANDTFDATACTSSLDGTVTSFGAGQTLDDGMQFLPKGGFKANEWYQGTIAKTVTSSANVPMDDDYVWHFRVRNSPDPCEIASVTVSPEQNALTDIYSDTADHDTNENITWSSYKANPADDVCNVLDCTPYVWAWKSDTSAAGIVNPAICTPEVRALAETPVATPALITAAAQNKSGTGELNIKFAPPQVIDEWPACQAACLNAQVAASFNVPVKNISNQTVKLFTCNNETCATSTEVSNYTVSSEDNTKEHLAVVHPPGGNGLAPNQYYRVAVLGGSNGVLSMPGAELVKTNYIYGSAQTPAFSWTFRTTASRCVVDRVDMSPPAIATKVIDSYHSITAVPVSSPDSCSAAGERLDESGLGLAWSVSPPAASGAAALYDGGILDVSPLSDGSVTSACLNSGTVYEKPVCGDGKVEDGAGKVKTGDPAAGGGEECDLGYALNGQKGSGCSANCLLTGDPAVDKTCGDGKVDVYTLGDGKTQAREQCDLGAANDKPGASGSGSGCSSTCLREGAASVTPSSTCGNGDLADNEQCDDGNQISGDGCSAECLDEGSMPGPFSVCGNTKVEAGEDCDLGSANGQLGSGCSKSCLLTGTPACTGKGQSNCCGNGKPDGSLTDPGEAPGCDLGWDAAANQPKLAEGCDKSCRKIGSSMSYGAPTYDTVSVCGDHNIGTGEAADPGALKGDIDATQYAQAVGKGTTLDANNQMVSTITASTGGKNGQAQFALQCGFTTTDACRAIDPHLALGANSCCYLVPQIVSMTPANGGANICRNPLISAEFDQQMDEASLAGKVTVTEPVPASGVCPTVPAAIGGGSAKNTLWNEFTKILSRLVAYVAGRPAAAAPGSCTAPGTLAVETRTVVLADGVTTAKHTVVTYALTAALSPSAHYTVSIDASVKSANGIPLGSTPPWSFTTGTDICTLDEVDVAPSSYLFSAQYSSNVTDPNSSGTFTATPVHLDASGASQPIASIDNVYAWTLGWTVSTEINSIIGNIVGGVISLFPSPGSVPGATVMVGVKTPTNGEGTLAANAAVTIDTVNTPSTKGKALEGTADLTIMICNDPWPARAANGSWKPAQNATYNYSFYYCRDAADAGGTDLPALTETPSSPKNIPDPVIDEYLYTYVNTLGNEGIGIRVAKNRLHLSATEWYASQGFKGSLTQTKVDGYDAVTDGSTTYVNAPALGVSGGNYTDIFILSSSVGAGAETSNIFGQIVKNFRFIANRDGKGNLLYNDLDICTGDSAAACGNDLDCVGSCDRAGKKACTNDTSKTCVLDADCAGGACQAVCSNDSLRSCTKDADCSLGSCQADRSKIRRDVKRLSDIRLIAEAAAKVKDATGAYPQIPSGSFITGQTVSTWPSWGKEFAAELGGTPPPDPVNKMAACPAGSDYEAGTCWSPSKQNASCPAGSHVYRYMYPNGGAYYGYTKEEPAISYPDNCATLSATTCLSDPLCLLTPSNTCETRIAVGSCNGQTFGAGGMVCGDGNINEPGKDCEKSVNPTQTIACGTGNVGTEVDTCGADCHWIKGSCAAPHCGNGIKETGEACDQGALNGTYGHCNAACTGIGQSCGDGVVEQGESCDKGAQNGIWHLKADDSCSFDCHSAGLYCGDGTVTSGNEECDGNTATSAAALPNGQVDTAGQSAACGIVNGYQTARTETCSAACAWNQWGPCLPTGSCGNGVKDGSEQCDNGAANSDTGACTTSCKTNVCGDAKVYSGHEQCDEGAGNIDPTDTAAIAKLSANCSLQSCYYCSNTCTVRAVSGTYCGDHITNGNEQCDDGTGNVDINNQAAVTAANNATYANGCPADLSKCKYCSTQCNSIAAPFCGDGLMPEGDKECDSGLGLNSNQGSCLLSCKKAVCGDGFVETGIETCDDGAANGSGWGQCLSDCSGRICRQTDAFVVSNTNDVYVATRSDMSDAVKATDVKSLYNGGGYDVVGAASYIWSATWSAPGDGVHYESKYFRQNLMLNCKPPASAQFILHINVDDEVIAYVNGTMVQPNPGGKAGVTMSNLASPAYKVSAQFDITNMISKGSFDQNILTFEGRNFYGPAFLAWWLEIK